MYLATGSTDCWMELRDFVANELARQRAKESVVIRPSAERQNSIQCAPTIGDASKICYGECDRGVVAEAIESRASKAESIGVEIEAVMPNCLPGILE